MKNGAQNFYRVASDMVVAEMWACPQCNNNSFLSRPVCFRCGTPKPGNPKVRVELWPQRLAAKGGGKGRAGGGCEGGGKGVRKEPVLVGGKTFGRAQGQKGKGGSKSGYGGGFAIREEEWQGKGVRGAIQRSTGLGSGGGREEQGGKGEGEEEGEPKPSWSEVVRGRGKAGIATRPKAKAKEGAKQERKEDTSDERGKTSDEEMPTQFMQPPPRYVLASRAEVLKVKVEEIKNREGVSRKLQRVQDLLADTDEQLKEAGGGTENRRHFALVNCSKKINKIEKSQERVHQQMEEIEEARLKLDVQWGKVEAKAKKNTRLLENEKSKYAYLARNLAQEGGQLVQDYEGLRESAIRIRGALQQQGRTDLVADLDRFEVLANTFNPPRYEANKDPLLLGLEVSEEEEDSQEEGDSSDSGGEMELEEERRGKKRQWGEGGGAVAQKSGGGQAEEARKENQMGNQRGTSSALDVEWENLQRGRRDLEYTVDANRQIAEQERMQQLQDKEAEAILAAAQIAASRGLQVGACPSSQGKVAAVVPNPRLELCARRRQASTPRKACRGQRRWGDISVPAREAPYEMEVEDWEGRQQRKDKARADNSRSPRGRRGQRERREDSL